MNKEEKIKISKKILNFLFLVLLVTFLGLYVSQVTGYYDYEQHQKMVLTEEKIKQFEKDVKEGKELDLNDYFEETSRNYQNRVSGLGYQLSTNINKYVKLSIKKTFGFLNKLLDDS